MATTAIYGQAMDLLLFRFDGIAIGLYRETATLAYTNTGLGSVLK